nr:5'-3' exoribonuclease 1 [Molossus molossus]
MMPSSSHLFGSMPWGPPVPVSGKPFHHTYSGPLPMSGGMTGGVHNQFIPLQVTKKRVANKKNFENKEAQSSQATALQTSQPGSSSVTKAIPQESPSASASGKSSALTQPAPPVHEAAPQGPSAPPHKAAASSSRRKARKLAVNFGVSKPSE